jgi:cytochrome c-type biogenesis protein CcmE
MAMKNSGNTLRIGIAAAVIVGTIVWLAFSGYGANKSYLRHHRRTWRNGRQGLSQPVARRGLRRARLHRAQRPHVDFTLNEFESHNPKAASGRLLKVSYKGSEPPPDTFKDDSQALAEGSYGRDGVFHASVLQAKCASKYAPATPGAHRPSLLPQAAPLPNVPPANSPNRS